jgi:hypothetical protein
MVMVGGNKLCHDEQFSKAFVVSSGCRVSSSEGTSHPDTQPQRQQAQEQKLGWRVADMMADGSG